MAYPPPTSSRQHQSHRPLAKLARIAKGRNILMNNILRGLYSGLIAAVVLALLYFVDYGPGNGLYGVANWFALGNKDTGKFIGFILIIVLGALFGLVFGLLQRNRQIMFSRALVTGLAL